MPNPPIIFAPPEVSAYYAVRVSKLSQRGRQWRGTCPLHRGKRSSFSVNPETGCWKCFSDCGRGGSLIDFEMLLTGADFRSALASIFAVIGRPLPERSRMTRDEWIAARNARERENHERIEAVYFADAAATQAEDALEALGPFDEERAIHTRLIASLLSDPYAVFLDWRNRHPKMTAALVETGRRSDLRLQISLKRFIEKITQEDCRDAA